MNGVVTPTIDDGTYHGLDVTGGTAAAPGSLIRLRAGTAQQWADAEIAGRGLACGELAVVGTDLVRGDGATKVASLSRIGSVSSALTGTPTAPTAAVDTSTTQVATCAFVVAQAASATPLVAGTAAVGTSTRFARGDHVHPVAAAIGTAVLTGGTVDIADTHITASSVIRLAYGARGGTPGAIYVAALSVGVGFTVTSTSGTDTSSFRYDVVSY